MRALLIALLATAVCAQETVPPTPDATPLARRHIYVPAQELDLLLARSGGEGVVMEMEEYLSLRAAAQASPALPESPVPGTVRRATYKGRATEDGLVFTLELDVDLQTSEWVRLPFGLAGAAVSKLSGEDGILAFLAGPQGKDPGYGLIVKGRGRHLVQAEFAVPLLTEAGDRRARFDLPRAVAGELVLELAGAQEVHVQPPVASIETTGTGDAALTTVRMAIGRVARIDLAWHVALQGGKESVVTAVTAQTLAVARDVAQLAASMDVNVYHAPVRELELDLPAGFDVLTVDSEDLASWTVTERAPARVLAVRYRAPFQGARNVKITGESAVPEGDTVQLIAPLVTPLGVLSAPGSLGIVADSRLQVTVAAVPATLRRASAQELSLVPAAGQSVVSAFRFGGRTVGPTLQITPEVPGLEAVVAMLLGIEESRMVVHYDFQITARGGPGFGFDVEVPAGWVVDEVSANRQDFDYEIIPKEGAPTLVRGRLDRALPPEESFHVSVSAQQQPANWRDDWTKQSVVFPMPGLPGVKLVDGTYGILTEPIFELREESSRSLVPLDLATLREVLGRVESGFGYRLQGADPALILEVRRVPTRVDLTSILLFSPEDETLVRVRAVMRWTFAGGGARQLELELPAGTGDTVRFLADGIAEKERTTSASNGKDHWKITLQERITGAFELALEWDLHGAAGATFDLPDVVALSAGGSAIRRELGWILVEAGDEVEVTAIPKGLEALSQVELPELGSAAPKKMLVEQYRYYTHDWQLALKIERHDPVDLLGGYAHSVTVDTWIDAAGAARTWVLVKLQSNAKQFLEVAIPQGATLWSVLVDNVPVQPSRSATSTLLVPIARAAGSIQEVRLVYENAIPDLGSSGTLELGAPAFDVTVLESSWQLHKPQDYEMLESRGDLSPSKPLVARPDVVEFLIGLGKALRGVRAMPMAGMAADGAERQVIANIVPEDMPAMKPALDAEKPSGRREGIRSLDVSAPSFGDSRSFLRLGGGGTLFVRYRLVEREPFSYWLTAIATLVLAGIAIRRAGWRKRQVVLVLLLASALLPYLLGGAVLAAANGLFAAALLVIACAILGWFGRLLGFAPRVRAVAPALAFIALMLAPSANAQEAPQKSSAPAPPAPGVPVVPSVSVDPASPDEPVVVLYDPATGLPPAESARQVYVPDAIFQELYRRAAVTPQVAAGPGLPWIFRDARYRLAFSGDERSVVGTAEFELFSFEENWFEVGLGLRDVLMQNATADGQPAVVRRSQDGSLSIALSGAGPHKLKIDLAVTLQGNQRTGSASFAIPPSALTTVVFAPGRAGLDVTLPGSHGAREWNDGKLTAYVGETDRLQLAWQPQAEDAGAAIVHLDSRANWRFTPAGVEVVIDAAYSIERGSVTVTSWELPADFEVMNVEGQGIRDWSLGQENGKSVLQVLWIEPLRARAALRLTLSGKPASEIFTRLTHLSPREVSIESGKLFIHDDPALEVTVAGDAKGLTRLGKGDAAPAGWPEARLAFGFVRRPYDLTLTVKPRRPRVTAELSARFAPRDRGIQVAQSLRLQVEGAPLATLDVELPPGLRLDRVQPPAGARAIELTPPPGGLAGSTLRLVFDQPLLGAGVLVIRGLLASEGFDPDVAHTLPLLTVPDIETIGGDVQVSAMDDREPHASKEDGLVSVEAAGLSSLFPPVAGQPLLGYRFRDAAQVNLVVRALALAAHVEVHVLTDIFARDEFVDLRYALSVSVDPKRGGIDTFSFDLPEDVVDVEVLTAPPLRTTEHALVTTPAGPRKRWTLQFQSKLHGPFGLELAVPLEYDEGGRARIPGLAPQGASMVGGHLVVENASGGKIDSADVRGLVAITRSEVPGLDESRRPVLAFRVPEPGAISLELVLSRFERQEQVSAVVELMTITTVVAEDGSMFHEAELIMRNRDRQFLSFDLPAGAELWSVHVGGDAVRPVAGKDGATMVRIRKTEASDRNFTVVLVYRGKPAAALGGRGSLRGQAPHVRDLEVMQTFWNLDLPANYRFSGFGGELEPADDAIYAALKTRLYQQENDRVLKVAEDATRSTEDITKAVTNLRAIERDLIESCNIAVALNPVLQGASMQNGQLDLAAAVRGTAQIRAKGEQLRDDAEYLRRVQSNLTQNSSKVNAVLGKALERTQQQSEALTEQFAGKRGFVQAAQAGEYKELGQSFYEANDAQLVVASVDAIDELQAQADGIEATTGVTDKPGQSLRKQEATENLNKLVDRLRNNESLEDWNDDAKQEVSKKDLREEIAREKSKDRGELLDGHGEPAQNGVNSELQARYQGQLEQLKNLQQQIEESTEEPVTLDFDDEQGDTVRGFVQLENAPQPSRSARRAEAAEATGRTRGAPAPSPSAAAARPMSPPVAEMEADKAPSEQPMPRDGGPEGYAFGETADWRSSDADGAAAPGSDPAAPAAQSLLVERSEHFTGNLGVGGGGGGSFGGRFGGVRPLQTQAGAGKGVSLKSLALTLPRAPESSRVTSSFMRPGAAGALEISYVSNEQASLLGAIGYSLAALLLALAYGLVLSSLAAAKTFLRMLGLGGVAIATILTLLGHPFLGLALATGGVGLARVR